MRNYMDADGNGVVGMEDFKNFMSVCRLQDIYIYIYIVYIVCMYVYTCIYVYVYVYDI